MDGSVALRQAKKYVDETLKGAGALKGEKGDPGKDGKDGTNGKDGVSPVIQTTAISGGWRVTVTDAEGSYDFDIMNGADGKNGKDGRDGIDGKDGTNGRNGVDGTDGLDGKNGKDGQDGAKGDKGEKGDKGDKGDKGERGDSFAIAKVYASVDDMTADADPVKDGLLVAVIDNNNALVYIRNSALTEPGEGDYVGYKYMTNLKDATVIRGQDGAKGDKGDKGDPGEKGEPGVPGKDGIDGLPGKDGKNGVGGVNGVDGKDGKDGAAGADGKDGKDATINGLNVINIEAGDNVEITQEGNTMTISATGGGSGGGGGTGSGGTTNYNDLSNKPKINNIELKGNLTIEQLGIIKALNDAIAGGSINVEANFLTEGGFGNLRYYQGKLEYFDTATQTWVETSVTPDNIYIFNMMPQAMRFMAGIYDIKAGHYKLMFEEPADTVIDGQVACVVEKVVIRRKLGGDPENENDGTLVATITRPNFGTYKDKWYVDNFFSPNMGEEWYYKAFPISTTGFANVQSDNSTGGMLAKNYHLFGYKIDQNESDPDTMVSYIEDNKRFAPAFMDYSADRFNYGSWGDAFFMPRPCMLNTDGTVAYYLDPDDYTKKIDGTDSDVANVDFDGNAMNEWGKIFWKVTDNGDGTGTFLFSDKKVDENFVCWSNIDENGNEIPHFYTPLYDGCLIEGRLRSLSGQTPMTNKTRQQELDYAHANNPDGVHMYETDVMCDVQLFRMLCVLISRSTNSKKAFGTGNNNSYVSTSNIGVKNTGTMNKKGMFWGDQTNKVGVKVLGREHAWGNIWKNCAGWINNKGIQKIKMTYGQSDGSAVDGYNITGDGYITIEDATPSGTSGGYISLCKFTENGIIPKQANGSSTTKYCDGLWFNNSQVNYAVMGGDLVDGAHVGTFCSGLNGAASATSWNVGAGLSCKPILEIQAGGATA